MKTHFAPTTAFIGVDVASKELVINLYGQDKTLALPNTRASISKWLATLPDNVVIAAEATGSYHELLLTLAHARGLGCYLLNPKDVRHYAHGVGQRSKTDHVDAQLIARYLAKEHEHLHLWEPSSAASRLLARLLGRRAKLVAYKSAMKKSLGDLPELRTELKAVLEKIDRLIRHIEARIPAALAELPEGKAQSERLRQIPGVGPLTAAMLTNVFSRVPFTRVDAVVAFAGMDPRANDSGAKRGRRRLSKRGPSELRRLLYNAAMAASKSALWKPFYERERQKGLPTTAALNVLARRLLRLAFTLFRTQSDFDPNVVKNTCAQP